MSIPHETAESVRATVVAVAHHVDRKRWDDLRTLFAAEVDTDYTSLFGGEPRRQTRDALVEGWRGTLARVVTQHLLGPVTLDVSDAAIRASCHVRGLHQVAGAPGGDLWEVLGHYEFVLTRGTDGWAVAALTLHTFLQTGNTRLLPEAQSTG